MFYSKILCGDLGGIGLQWLPSGGSVVKNSPADAGDTGDVNSIPGSGRSPGEGNGNPFQYSCLGNPIDRGAWWATHSLSCVQATQERQTRLSD